MAKNDFQNLMQVNHLNTDYFWLFWKQSKEIQFMVTCSQKSFQQRVTDVFSTNMALVLFENGLTPVDSSSGPGLLRRHLFGMKGYLTLEFPLIHSCRGNQPKEQFYFKARSAHFFLVSLFLDSSSFAWVTAQNDPYLSHTGLLFQTGWTSQ